jgi:hypothetical protein
LSIGERVVVTEPGWSQGAHGVVVKHIEARPEDRVYTSGDWYTIELDEPWFNGATPDGSRKAAVQPWHVEPLPNEEFERFEDLTRKLVNPDG